MSFIREAEPARGVALAVLPGIRRVVAPNPSVMTYWGTNTYLIDVPGGVVVLDPGPDDAGHVAAVAAAAGAPVVGVLLSHTHHDHVGGLAGLQAATGAPMAGWHSPAAPGVTPEVALRDEEAVPFAPGWRAVFTPGHAADHVCFAGPDGVVFSADHVMGWSSSVVGPPGGNMAAYFASLRRLLGRGEDRVYLPGHGPAIEEPQAFVRDLLAHREAREGAILAALCGEPRTAQGLMEALYSKIDPTLKRAAERNVAAHLQKLREEGRARDTGAGWVAA